MQIGVKSFHRNSLSLLWTWAERWRPLRHSSDLIRHCAGTTVGQTLL